MKKVISIVLAVIFIFVLATGCGNTETENPITQVEVTFPDSTGTEAVVEGEAVIATELYILSRAYCEKLETFDTDNFNAEEYSNLLAETSEALRIAEAFCTSLEGHAETLEEMEENGLVKQEKSSYKQLSTDSSDTQCSPFLTIAYAAEDSSAAVKYAEELTKTFDSAKNGQKLKAVAEKYGTDIKKAKAMVDQAQAILEGAAYEDQAAFENKCYEAAVETKAAASILGYGLSIAVTGGAASGVMEVGGLVCGGLQVLIDTGKAATIHVTNGEGNVYTEVLDKIDDTLAPISTVFSIGDGFSKIADIRNPDKAAEIVDNAAQLFLSGVGYVRDYVQDDKVLGVSSEVYEGYKKILLSEASCSNKDAVKEVMTSVGISEETLENTADTDSEEINKASADAFIESFSGLIDVANPVDIEAFIESINAVFAEKVAEESTEQASEESTEQTAEESTEQAATQEKTTEVTEAATETTTEQPEMESETAADANTLPTSELEGTYAFEGEYSTWSQIVTAVDETHLKFVDAEDPEAIIIGSYDENTGVFNYTETAEEDGETMTATVKVTFKAAGSEIEAVMVLTYDYGEEVYQTTFTAVRE